jgi:hypothetical protein
VPAQVDGDNSEFFLKALDITPGMPILARAVPTVQQHQRRSGTAGIISDWIAVRRDSELGGHFALIGNN